MYFENLVRADLVNAALTEVYGIQSKFSATYGDTACTTAWCTRILLTIQCVTVV